MIDSRMPDPEANRKRVGLHYKRFRKCFIDSTRVCARRSGDSATFLSPTAKVGLMSGSLLVTNAAFSVGGVPIAHGTHTFPITNGVVNIQLAPTDH
ncbi:MAG: hypothetical protein WA634_12730, partial [Silvibacterium sp.]